jgi:6-phosphogluconolactonase
MAARGMKVPMISRRIDFSNREALAIALAHRVAQALSAAITRQNHATLAVSGGTTPTLFFDHLSREEISWEKVTVTLVDERQVPEDSPRSNARLVRHHLINNNAAPATFEPLYRNPNAAKLPPFDACILGMGTDGHTASFFPGGDTLANAIDPDTDKAIIDIFAPGSGEPRVTFTLPRIVSARFLALHIEGKEKAAVLEKARGGDDAMTMPIRAVLNAAAHLNIYWCP